MTEIQIIPCFFGDDGLCSQLLNRKTPFKGDENIQLSNCKHDVSEHLRSLQLARETTTVQELIMNRSQKDFSLSDDIKVCPYHRYYYGIDYQPSTKCCHPNHVGNRKGDRKGVSSKISERCYQEYQVRLWIGERLCRKCREDERLKTDSSPDLLGKYFNKIL